MHGLARLPEPRAPRTPRDPRPRARPAALGSGVRLIAYSLGNFLFANTDERSRDSGVLRVRYRPEQRCPERASFHPVRLGEPPTFTPAPAPAPHAAQIRERMHLLSKRLRTPLREHDEALVLQGWPCSGATAPTD